MKSLSLSAFGIGLTLSTAALAQVDIYQSDAYSVEEMCAREAAQTEATDYGSAYERCIEKNRSKPMYQAGADRSEVNPPEGSDSGGTIDNEQ